MTDVRSSDERDNFVVRPTASTNLVGEVVAENIFNSYGNPASISMDKAGLAICCALAVQAALNAMTGEWQND